MPRLGFRFLSIFWELFRVDIGILAYYGQQGYIYGGGGYSPSVFYPPQLCLNMYGETFFIACWKLVLNEIFLRTIEAQFGQNVRTSRLSHFFNVLVKIVYMYINYFFNQCIYTYLLFPLGTE